ncbi:MarR family winged helix-turn-helix transcriptional regulator [Peribacillus sp. SCS-37]|uniref:MarR family winged helix-turn-helix transcriptional regulator n=1 Tax=Paraperibacillus esterisolvens TaxID=3115296 RepID=UPI0039066BC4
MLYRPFESRLNELLSCHKLQRSQWTVFFYLHTYGPATLVELANYQRVEKPNITRTVHRLEELGYIVQVPSADKREKRIQLTETGHGVYQEMRVIIDKFEVEILAGIPEKQQKEMIEAMAEIRNTLIKRGKRN